MGTAAQIRNYRVRAGKSRSEVAKHLGLNDAWYHDLEHQDDELARTLTLFQAIELSAMLGAHLRDLLDQETLPEERISLMALPSRIEAHVAHDGITIAQFEEQLGWQVHDLLQSPAKAAAEYPIIFLQAVAKHLGINWLSLVPDDHAA
jgi:transcriptional regulator with XRE-family HTH domain